MNATTNAGFVRACRKRAFKPPPAGRRPMGFVLRLGKNFGRWSTPDLIARAPRSFYNSTSIGSGLNFATAQIARAPFEAERRAIDVSGDGTNNAGPDVQFFRDQAVARGILVNGLVILTDIELAPNPRHTNPPGDIEKYYRDNVIGGAGAFVTVAEDYNSFGRAMVKKLIAEIATGPERWNSVSTVDVQAQTTSAD